MEQDEKFEEVYVKKSYRKKRYRLTGSLGAKITVFFLFVFCCFIGVGAGIFCMYMGELGYYSSNLNDVLMSEMSSERMSVVYEARSLLRGGAVADVEKLCQDKNIDLELLWVDENNNATVLWGTWDGYDTNLTTVENFSFIDTSKTVTLNNHTLKTNEKYLFHVYFDPQFPKEDNFQRIARQVTTVYDYRYTLIGVAAGFVILSILCFIFLMCSAGHRNGREGITSSVLTGVHLDILTAVFVVGAFSITYCMIEIGHTVSRNGLIPVLLVLSVGGIALTVWLTIYFMELALRLKLGKCWRHSLIFIVLRGGWRLLRFLGRGIWALVKGIPLVYTTIIAYLGEFIVEAIYIVSFVRESSRFVLWFLGRLVLLPVIMYIALNCKKLLKASRALAEGQEDYRVDTSKMFGEFKEHGENLNSLGQGISKAVAERMKSEHLKTELITNVSHDIKTPLTSIINYADLICEETKEKEVGSATEKDRKIAEYADVLLRQSRRLKKLLEDLMEASKATTGNLEVNLEPCEVGVLLSQAVGEYQKRMEEKGLELIARQPQESIKIMADGRHLWRVFENLLNNICKYAQENTRVYLSVEVKEGNVKIIFRNMSKYPLDISADELGERFVRGDKSRHMEGNGLGLSIAGSLIELQNGQMEIVTDGDLFKVVLTFRMI